MIDPICGMEVEPNTAAGKHKYNERTYLFCSIYCLDAFKKNPEQFLKARAHAGGVDQSDADDRKPPLFFSPETAAKDLSSRPPQETARVGARSLDPVCGMSVDPDNAAGKYVHNGQTFYFCSPHCLARFQETPDKFLKSGGQEHGDHAHAHEHMTPQSSKPNSAKGPVYVCPMDPEVRAARPGACPKCGMALEPAAPALATVETEYVCPMHPQIVRDEPGSCPICG